MKRVLGFVSGAPRVSTRPEAAASGPRSHILGVLRAFERLGWEVRTFIAGDYVPLRWVIREAELELGLSSLKRLSADLLRLGFAMYNGRRALQKIGSVDWVYERFGAFQFLGYGFQRRGIPWILETNGLYFIEASRDRGTLALTRLERTLELWAYRRADVIVTVSDELKTLLAEYGVDPGKIVVVPNAVDTERFAPERVQGTAFRLLPPPIVGFVGTLSSWQGLDVLISALADLRAEGLLFSLVVVGDGPMRTTWERLAHAVNISDRVRFVGRVAPDQVPNYIAGFDLAYSGQVPLAVGQMYHSPLKLYEYMAMGKPVIASSFTDARRLVGAGETGYLFQPGDVEDLKRVLRRAYAEREEWPRMGEQARRKVIKEHSWEARISEMVRRVEAILEAKYGTPYPSRGRC